jgi:G3E family GTPase
MRTTTIIAAAAITTTTTKTMMIEHALTELDTGNYGMILRSKGIVDGGADGWLEFDYVPGEWEVRQRGADVGGKLVVIGSKLDEHAIAALFGC